MKRVGDVGETTGEDPEALVDDTGVEHLDHHLDVLPVEEPKVAGVGGQLDRLALAGVALWGGPADFDAEAVFKVLGSEEGR